MLSPCSLHFGGNFEMLKKFTAFYKVFFRMFSLASRHFCESEWIPVRYHKNDISKKKKSYKNDTKLVAGVGVIGNE